MVQRVQVLLRFRPPRTGITPGLVHRQHLDVRLSRGVAGHLTVVSAGPGSGKTLAVASWLDRGGPETLHTAWLTVDGTDNDLATFWSDVLDALRVSGVLGAGSALGEIVPAGGFGIPELRQILAGLSELPTPVVLVLDDFQVITSAAVLDSIGQLLEQQPPQLRLVLITRADPSLRLHRLRVSGHLTEIRAHDLAFSEAETAELFAAAGIDLSGEQLRTLHTRTQGWPAGVRLAAMSLSSGDIDRGIARFSGTEGSVAEYLISEVLAGLPADEQEFLLKTSIVERLTGELAGELSGRPDSQQLLETLVRANAFVVGFGDPVEWFGYHPLFRETLLHRLRVELPDAGRGLHLRAARWFAGNADPIAGIRHAIAAQAWDDFGRLIINAAPLLLTVHSAALAVALEPAAARAATHPGWSTLLAAAVCHYQDREYPAMHMDAAEAGEFLAEAPEDIRASAPIMIGTVEVAYARTNRPGMLTQAAADLLALVDGAPRRVLQSGRHYRVVATNNLASGSLWDGNLTAARTHFAEAGNRARELGLELAGLNAQSHLALLDMMHGRHRDAHHKAVMVKQSFERRGWGSEIQALPIYLTLGLIHLSWNQSDQAVAEIGHGLAVSRPGSDRACRLALCVAAVQLAIAGPPDREAVRSAAARLDTERGNTADLPDMLTRWCTAALAEAHLAVGEPGTAMDLIDPTRDRAGYAGALESVTLARAHLTVGHARTAVDLLAPVLRPHLPYRYQAVEARILQAVALTRLHRTTAALEAISGAVDLAQPEGLLRPFVSAGPALTDLLIQFRHVAGRHFDFTNEILEAVRPQLTVQPVNSREYEQLTDRELLVLQYLPTMLKSSEIAADLYVSVNTVKTHLRAIYRKLDVPNRREAVERARAMKVI